MMVWNEIDLGRLRALLEAGRERPFAVVILPHDAEQWLVIGPVLDAITDRDHPEGVGVSSTFGAEHISSVNADVFVYRLPKPDTEQHYPFNDDPEVPL